MRKVIAAINMTLEGVCDHTVGVADEQLHQHYTDLLNNSGVALYGRITYQLMEYWPPLLENPTGEKTMDDFAIAIDRIPKIVFSRTLHAVTWATAQIAEQGLEESVAALKQQEGKYILACSPSIIAQLTNLNLIDEYHLCIHPVIAGGGLPLFKNIEQQKMLKLIDTKTFGSGAVVMRYRPA